MHIYVEDTYLIYNNMYYTMALNSQFECARIKKIHLIIIILLCTFIIIIIRFRLGIVF